MLKNESGLSFGGSTQVILVGTADYPADPTLENIPQVRSNLDNLQSLFLDPGVIGVSSLSITSILNETHSSELLNKVNSIANEALDTLIIYYVGHGLYGDEDSPLYLATTSTTDVGKAFNGVDYNKLKKIVGSCPAKQKIVILDCCYSGSALEGGLSGSISSDVADIAGTFVLTASAANKRALAPPEKKHTLFTGALIDVIENGREQFSSTITLSDVYSEVVKSLAAGEGPKPERSTWKDADDFRIAFNQFGRQRGSQQTLALLQLMESNIEELRVLDSQKTTRIERLEKILEGSVNILENINAQISTLQNELESASRLIWFYRLRFVFFALISLMGLLVIGLWVGNL